MDNGVKIVFGLADEQYQVESLWAVPMESGGYLIDNIPWYVREVALGDVVEAAPGEDGRLYFAGEILRHSGNRTVRLRLAEESLPRSGAIQEALERLGAESELDPSDLMAVNIPAAVSEEARKFLEAGSLQGHWQIVD